MPHDKPWTSSEFLPSWVPVCPNATLPRVAMPKQPTGSSDRYRTGIRQRSMPNFAGQANDIDRGARWGNGVSPIVTAGPSLVRRMAFGPLCKAQGCVGPGGMVMWLESLRPCGKRYTMCANVCEYRVAKLWAVVDASSSRSVRLTCGAQARAYDFERLLWCVVVLMCLCVARALFCLHLLRV